MKKIELLAPAGSMESLIGAINSGAQAVYLAGKRFGARAYANNFGDEELIEVIRYAHLRGIFVYVAINTLVFDDEIEELLAYTDFLVMHDIDALIVQDLGVMHLLIKRYPNLDIHASTQVNAHNIDQVKFLKSLGVKRIVLARETSIETIRLIKKEVDIELEVFIHGALCVSFSGNCLMSSMIGGRSGNRGECAQPCRMPYSLYKDQMRVSDKTYLLSTKDLMTIEHVDLLIEAGVDSFKIEGRMRKPEYVIQTVLSYRKAIEAYIHKKSLDVKKEVDLLERVFNREFTKGYLFNEEPNKINQDFRPNHLGIEIGKVIDYQDHKAIILLSETLSINDGYRIIGKNKDYGNAVSRIITEKGLVKKAYPKEIIKLDVTEVIEKDSVVMKTLDYELESKLDQYLDTNFKTIALTGYLTLKSNHPMKLIISDGIHQIEVISAGVLEHAVTQKTTHDQVLDQLTKLGQTPFYFSQLEIDMTEDLFIPIKWINELRRDAILKMKELRESQRKPVLIVEYKPIASPMQPIMSQLVVKVQTKDQLDTAIKLGIETIYYEDIVKAPTSNLELIPVKKRVQMHQKEVLSSPSVIHDIGFLHNNPNNYTLITDTFLNVVNSYTAALLSNYHVSSITLSPELSLERIQLLNQNYLKNFKIEGNFELVVYGKTDLMISKYCPIAKTFKTKVNCHLCEKNQYYLEDRVGVKFPLINDGNCNLRILGHKPLNLVEYIPTLKASGIKRLRLDFTTETKDDMKKIIEQFQLAMNGQRVIPQKNTFTYGRFLK